MNDPKFLHRFETEFTALEVGKRTLIFSDFFFFFFFFFSPKRLQGFFEEEEPWILSLNPQKMGIGEL